MANVSKKIKIISAVSTAALLLGACGGGGGGVVSAVAPKSVTSTSAKISLLSNPSFSLDSVDATAEGKGVFVEATSNGTGGADVAVSRRTQTLTFNLEENNPKLDSDNRIEVVNSDGTSTGAMTGTGGSVSNSKAVVSGGNVELDDAGFGLIVVKKGSATAVGGYHVGKATTSMPTTSTATYRGKTLGIATSSNGAVVGYTGDTTVNANFGSGTVTGRNSNLNIVSGQHSGSALGADITMNGAIAGNNYSGSSALVTPGTNRNIGTSGPSNLSGGFYGAGAGETTGAYSASSTDVNGISITAVGAYGAQK